MEYDRRLLEAIPQEVLDKDYGCGDPSRHVRPGETVLDLGSGTGKICFLAAQIVGPAGRVIGVDMTDDMLGVARRNAPAVADRLGYANVEFLKGRIQDLELDLERLDAELVRRPIRSADAFMAANELAAQLRLTHPLVQAESVDVVVSNCVLNLVESQDKRRAFAEIFRVRRNDGRAVISDIVCDEDVPEAMRQDPALWSGCIRGAWREDLFLRAFEEAGFHGIRLLRRDAQPGRTVQGMEFRSLTVEAFKGKEGDCLEFHQAVIYRGPFREVVDDDGHRLRRGDRVAVCDKTFRLYQRAPYAECFEFISPRVPVKPEEARAFDCAQGKLRPPCATKGIEPGDGAAAGECCAAAHREGR